MFEILSVIITLCSLAIGAVSFVYSTIKRKKVASISNETEKAKEEERIAKCKLAIVESIPKYCQNAEQVFGQKNGIAKYSMVVSWIQIDCLTNGIPYDEPYFKEHIEAVLDAPQKKTSN